MQDFDLYVQYRGQIVLMSPIATLDDEPLRSYSQASCLESRYTSRGWKAVGVEARVGRATDRVAGWGRVAGRLSS